MNESNVTTRRARSRRNRAATEIRSIKRAKRRRRIPRDADAGAIERGGTLWRRERSLGVQSRRGRDRRNADVRAMGDDVRGADGRGRENGVGGVDAEGERGRVGVDDAGATNE